MAFSPAGQQAKDFQLRIHCEPSPSPAPTTGCPLHGGKTRAQTGAYEERAPGSVKLGGRWGGVDQEEQRESGPMFPRSHCPHLSFTSFPIPDTTQDDCLNQVTFLYTETHLCKRMRNTSKGSRKQGCLAFVGGSCENKCNQGGILETLRRELPACGKKGRIESSRKVTNIVAPNVPNSLFVCRNQAGRRFGEGIAILLRAACPRALRFSLGTTRGV